MIEHFQFYNAYWLWPVCVIGVLLLIFFIWKEYQTQVRGLKLYARAIAGLVAVFSLAMIALQPMRLQEIDKTEAVLLTKDYKQDRFCLLYTSPSPRD